MSGCPPKLRRDLSRRVQTAGGRTTHVIKDPVSREFFRLQEAEAFVADQLDGETSLDIIQSRVEEKFGAALEQSELTAFIKQLDRNGLLETERSAQVVNRKRPRRIAGGPLYFRLKLIDPERLLDVLMPWIRFLFTRHFVYFSSGTIVAAAAIGVLNWSEIVDDISVLLQLSTLPLLIAVIFITVSVHELAHALTCKRFGGEVREMGFMLLYFQPALYCNVSDAWLFPKKSKRLWVAFAGPYFELFLWAVAVLTWRIADPGTWISEISLVVIATSGIKTLFNFNPLIKLDGYYLLSDYLDVPNLRQKSFAYVGSVVKRSLGSLKRLPPVPVREKRILLVYGIAAWLFSVSLLSYIGWILGEYLIVEGQRMAFLGLTGLLGFRFRDKFTSLFGRRSGSSAGRKRKSSWRKTSLLKLGAGAAVVAVLLAGRMELRVAGPITVLPHHNADVRAGIAGVVDEIYVDEGSRVRKADPIARLSDREYRADLQKTEAEIRQMQARRDELVAGPTEAEIDVARRTVATAQDRLEFAIAKRARTEELFERKLVSNQEFDAINELETTARNELAEAKGRLLVLLQGTRPEQIAAAEAELARLDAQRRFLEGQLQQVNVLSPSDGIVTTPSRQLRELVRQAVPKGGLIAKVYELDIITVEAAISEKEIADVKIGQTVAIKTRAYPDRVFQGRVLAIGTTTQGSAAATSAPESSGDPSAVPKVFKTPTAIRVITEIDNSSGLLKPGMTGMAKVYCGERRIIDLIVRRLSRTFRVEFWSWW